VSHDDAYSATKDFQRLLALAESFWDLGISLYQHEWHGLAMGS